MLSLLFSKIRTMVIATHPMRPQQHLSLEMRNISAFHAGETAEQLENMLCLLHDRLHLGKHAEAMQLRCEIIGFAYGLNCAGVLNSTEYNKVERTVQAIEKGVHHAA